MMKFRNLICAALLGGAILINGAVEAGIVTDRLPLTCYCDHRVYTYNNANGSQVGYIDANVDLIQVTQIRSDGWAYGNYPGRNGRVSRWFRMSDLCSDVNYSNRSANVNGAQRVYRTSSSGDTLGSVSNNESVIVVADNGNRAQIVYRLDNGTGYKMGWIPSSAVSTSSGRAGSGDVNSDGQVTQADADLLLAYLRGQTQSINRANSDVNGDGDISISDVQAILKKVRENPQPTPQIPSELQNLINTWSNRTWQDHYYSPNGIQCKEFAAFVYNKVYGYSYSDVGSTGSQKYTLNSNKMVCRASQSNLNASNVRELFQNAQPGDFIQMRRGHGGAHSAILVEKTNNGVTFFEANADGKNTIWTKTYSYDDLVVRKYSNKHGYYQYNVAMSVYHAR